MQRETSEGQRHRDTQRDTAREREAQTGREAEPPTERLAVARRCTCAAAAAAAAKRALRPSLWPLAARRSATVVYQTTEVRTAPRISNPPPVSHILAAASAPETSEGGWAAAAAAAQVALKTGR